MRLFTLAGMTGLMLAQTAFADTRMVFSNTSSAGTETTEMLIADNKMRFANGQGTETWSLFDADRKEMIIVDPSKKSYMVIDQETMNKMGDAVNQAMKTMEDTLAQMPPAQRKQMEQMMKSMMPAELQTKTVEFRYDRKGSDSVAGYDCEILEIRANDRKTSELCVTSPDALDIDSEDAAVFMAMRDFSLDMVKNVPFAAGMAQSFGQPGASEMPIRYVFSNDLIGQMSGQLVSVSSEDVDNSLLSIPSDYKREKMPDMSF